MKRNILLSLITFATIGILSSCSALKQETFPDITSGTIGSVKFLNESSRRDVAIGWPVRPFRLKTVGTARVAVLFVDFSDSVATANPVDLLAVQSEATDIYKTISYDRLDFHLDPLLKWIRMSKPYSEYHFARGELTFERQRSYIQEAINLAEADYDFKGVDSIVVISNPEAPFDFGPAFCPADSNSFVYGDGYAIKNGVTSGSDGWGSGGFWLAHESGHTMGLVDLYAFVSSASLDAFRFTGDFGFMGKSFSDHLVPEFLAWERWLLGWLDDDQIKPVGTFPTTVSLTPIESKGGLKAAIVPLSSMKGIVIESRHALGYDSHLTREGVLVYTIDTALESGYGPIVVQGGTANDLTKVSALLQMGDSITISGVTFTVSNQTSSGETVVITKN